MKIYSLRYVFFIIILFFSSPLTAQLKTSYLISSIKLKSVINNNISPFQFKSTSNCIDVQTGINVMHTNNGNEDFVINCAVKINFNTLGLKFYPNPVVNNAKVKFIGIPPLKDIYNLTIYSTTGALIQSRKETGYSLFQGLVLNLSTLPMGTYFIQIESIYTLDLVKFIKR